jgi:hypothetical protein
MSQYGKSVVPFRQALFFILVGCFLVFFVLLTLEQANPLDTKLERDSGIFLYASNGFAKGDFSYIASGLNKPPGIYFIDTFALEIGKGTRWGVWLLELLSLLISAILGFNLLRRQFGLAPALIGSAVWLLGLNHVLAGGNFTEEYSLPFGFAALLLWVISEDKKKTMGIDIGIGLCTGVSILLRPNNIGVQITIALTMIIFAIRDGEYRKLFSRLVIIAIAAFVPLLLVGLFFANHGAFREFIEASLLYNLFYVRGNLDLRGSLLNGATGLGVAGGISILGYFLAVSQARIRKGHSVAEALLLWIVINGVVEVVLSGLSGMSYEHYFICWMPFVAVSSAYLISRIFPGLCLWAEEHLIRLTLLAVLFSLLLFSDVPNEYVETFKHLVTQRGKDVQRVDPVAEYVNTHTGPNDLVLVWGGQAGINFLSKRNAPTHYILYPAFEPSPFADRYSEEYFQSLQKMPPALIVDGSVFDPQLIVSLDEKGPIQWSAEHGVYATPYLAEILNFIRKNYSLADVINNVPIYQQK